MVACTRMTSSMQTGILKIMCQSEALGRPANASFVHVNLNIVCFNVNLNTMHLNDVTCTCSQLSITNSTVSN